MTARETWLLAMAAVARACPGEVLERHRSVVVEATVIPVPGHPQRAPPPGNNTGCGDTAGAHPLDPTPHPPFSPVPSANYRHAPAESDGNDRTESNETKSLHAE
jgi:hypothetical protein